MHFHIGGKENETIFSSMKKTWQGLNSKKSSKTFQLHSKKEPLGDLNPNSATYFKVNSKNMYLVNLHFCFPESPLLPVFSLTEEYEY